jgi:hypothetical protein
MQNFDHNIEKNANFFAENFQKSQKIVIITSTPELVSSPPNSTIQHLTQLKHIPIMMADSKIVCCVVYFPPRLKYLAQRCFDR